jgi:cytochrome d ubiquinol oxidase subunit II
MNLADICIGLVVLGVTAYVVLGGADYGAGFWDLTAGGAKRGARLRGMIQRSMSPVWEANHVWLIFILVVLWTDFPVAFGSITSTLSIPLFLAAVGIIFRGSAFALRGEVTTIGEAKILGGTFALSSVITPFFLGTVIGGVASGRVPVGNAAGDPFSSWLNPTSIMIGVLAVAVSAYISAVFLAADAKRAGVSDLISAFRFRALLIGVIAGGIALGGLVVLHEDARYVYEGLVNGDGVSMLATSVIAGIVTFILVWLEKFVVARFTAAIAVGSITVGWALAQSPYLLPETLTVSQAAAPDATLIAMLIAVVIGLAVLLPSLFFLYKLVLEGRLEDKLKPVELGQRFRPLTAGDEEEEDDE